MKFKKKHLKYGKKKKHDTHNKYTETRVYCRQVPTGYQCDTSQTWLQWMNWCYVSRGTERQTLIHGVYNKHLPHYPHHSHHTSLWTHNMYSKTFHSIRPITVPSQRTYVHQSNNCMVVAVSFHSIRPITVPSQRTYVHQSNNCMVVPVSSLSCKPLDMT